MLAKLVQADMMLAHIAVEEARGLLAWLSGEQGEELEERLLRAEAHLSKTQEHIDARRYVVAVQFFINAWRSIFPYLLEMDRYTPPVVIIESPANNSYTNSSLQEISGSVLDYLVSLIENVTITVNGEAFSARLVNGSFSAEVELAEGENVIGVSVVDYFGNAGYAEVNITLDTLPPEINISGVEAGAYYNHSVVASVEVFDLHLAEVLILLNGEAYTPGEEISAEGAYVLEVFATDLAGNSAYEAVLFTIDTTPPEVAIHYPLAGSFVRGVVEINGSARDANLEGFSLKIDSAEVARSPQYAWNTSMYADGNHTLTLEAWDKAGNCASTRVEVTVDNTHPRVRITSPLQKYLRGNVTVDAEVEEANLLGVSVMLDGVELATSLPYVLDTTLYRDGNHTIEVYAYDRAGNAGSDAVEVVVDNTLPEVGFTSPTGGAFVRRLVEVDGFVRDANLHSITLTIDGVNVSTALPYLWNTSAYRDGNHTLRLTALDKAGNAASTEITVTVDNTPPSAEIIFPLDGAILRGIVNITAKAEDLFLDRFILLINGTVVAENETSFTWNTSAYEDGAYVIELVAVDKAGNVANASASVTIDNTPPELHITELNLYPTIDNPEYPLLISVNENASVTVNGEPVALENGSAVYTASISLGVNRFVVIATDLAGNSAEWEKTLLVDSDNLPDWYEVNVTATDPLNADSDSSLTPESEAGNGIPDDEEDFDGDALNNLQEFRLGTNPFSGDTDADGLTDSFEVFSTSTSPTSADTDGDGLSDAEEDLDEDALSNLQEQSLGTDPLGNDTDGDTLSDGYEVSIGTNPLSDDTDGDGLSDDSELRLGTNPLVSDSDGDGLADGNETFTQSFVNASAGVEATITAVGDASKSIVIAEAENASVLLSQLSGVVKVVEVSTASRVESAYIKIYYDPAQVENVSELRMFYYNESDNSLRLVEVQGVNEQEHYVWGNVTHLSTFSVASPSKWFSQWYVDWEKPELVLKPGEKMRIKARVHNLGKGAASNVEVSFYADSELIGSTSIASIAAGSSAVASIEWVVEAGVERIYVKVDPANLIAELDEGNNNACRDFSRYLDSDGDGLTDYEEIHGMRLAFPHAYVTTDPFNADTDGDGLSDGEEMGSVVYDYWNKLLYNSLRWKYGWPPYDGYHYEYNSDPRKADTDGDGFNDKLELEQGTNPFKPEPGWIEEAFWGFVLGDFGLDDPTHGNLAYLSGWILSGYLVIGDLRDLPSTVIRGDELDFALTAVGLVPLIGDAESTVVKVGKFAKAFKNKISSVIEFVLKRFPTKSTRYLDEILSELKGIKGYEELVHRIETGDKGAIFEAEVAVTKDANNIEWLGKYIITPEGSTDIDVLLKDGTIIEAKNIDWTRVTPGSDAYNMLKSDLGNKIKRFNAYDPTAKKIIIFKGKVDPDIKTWLEYEKGVIVEVIQ